MYQSHAKYFFLFILLFFYGYSFAQTDAVSNPLAGRENDPYSRYGIGELSNGNNTVLRGMGDITSAYANPYAVNSDNPASYSFLKLTTYEAGAQASTRNIQSGSNSYTSGTATLAYLNIGVPVGKNAGMCFGIRPYSQVYYNLADTVADALGGKTDRNYVGSGGLNYAYIGGAWQYKGLSVGVNFGYMFGTIVSAVNLDNLDTTKAYNSNFVSTNKIGGIYWKGGLMYEGNLSKDIKIRVGGTVTISQQINATRNDYWIGTYQLVDTLISDTAYQTGDARGKLKLPTSYSFGVQLAKGDKWNVGVDYSGTQWQQYSSGFSDSLGSAGFMNTSKFSLGGEFTPNSQNIRNFWSRVTYRVGLYYGNDYVQVQNTRLNFYGITVGGSLPFKRSFSHLHAALDIGKLGTKNNGLVQENYVRFTLGMSFSDKWFNKRKYE